MGGTANIYSYAFSNPIEWKDPTGLAPNPTWSCRELNDYLSERWKKIEKRWDDLKRDINKLPICKPGAPLAEDKLGHVAILLDLIARRNWVLMLMDAKGCDGPNDGPPGVSAFPIIGVPGIPVWVLP